MASDLRKAMALGNAALNAAGPYSYWNQRYDFSFTGTKWIRFWADWPQLQVSEGDGFSSDAWTSLDNQIRQANQDGLLPIVTTYRFPTWTNSARRGTVPSNDRYATFYVPDHVGYDYIHPVRGRERTPWSVFIEHLFIRYHPQNPGNQGAWAYCVEIMNEPNIQWRPQSGIASWAASMMRTARYIKQVGGYDANWPIILAPASGDSTESGTFRTPYQTFTDDLLAALNGWDGGPWFGWSHHNHRDIELDAGVSSQWPASNRAKITRDKVKNAGWAGWNDPTNGADPKLFLTEGGGRLNTIRNEWFESRGQPYSSATLRNKQADLLQRAHNRMYTGSDGTGMSMSRSTCRPRRTSTTRACVTPTCIRTKGGSSDGPHLSRGRDQRQVGSCGERGRDTPDREPHPDPGLGDVRACEPFLLAPTDRRHDLTEGYERALRTRRRPRRPVGRRRHGPEQREPALPGQIHGEPKPGQRDGDRQRRHGRQWRISGTANGQ